MATYVNDLRLKEIATGDEDGTWGTSTNTNLELIGEAFSFGTEAITTNADTHTTTIADGSTDPGRSMFLAYTGTLDSACTITIAPNTVSKLWFIENATSGSQNIIIKQGSGATITIPPGDTKAIYSDGAGSGGKMVDAFASLNVVDLKVQDDLTVTDDLIVNGDIDLEGAIDVNGTANLDVVDIDGAVDMATTLQVDGVATFTGRDVHSGGITIANAGQIGSVGDTDAIAIASDGVVTLTQKLVGTELDISGNVDVDGTTNLDVVDIDGAVDMATTLAVAGNVDFNGDLDVDGTTNLDVVDIDGAVNIATTALVTGVLTTTATQVATGGITSGSDIISDTDSTDSLGSTGVRWLKGWFDTLTAGTLTIGSGSVTDSSGAISFGNENLTTTGIVTAAGTSVFTNLDISGDVDVDGTTNLDIVDIDGAVNMATTLLVTGNVDFNGDLDVDGTTNLDVVDIDGAVNFAADVTFADGADIITASAGGSNFRAGVNAGNSIASGGNQNTVIGDEAGTAITTGDENVFIGFQSGDALVDGTFNVAMGSNSLTADTKGKKSVAIGTNALATQNFTSLTDTFNVAVGHSAGTAVTTGTENTILGGLAGLAATTASGVTLVGVRAGGGFTTGGDNTALGKQALKVATEGSGNTAVGKDALEAATTSSDNTAVGKFALTLNTTGTSNVAVGAYALDAATTTDFNTAVGWNALSTVITGTRNTAMGADAAKLSTASDNTAFGYHALDTTAGGSDNAAFGSEAMDANTSGSSNAAFGYRSLDGNETGNNNAAFGNNSLGATTGSDNTGSGSEAGFQNTSGSNNLFLGHDSGRTGSPGGAITTGSNEICLGDENITEAHIQVDWTVASDKRDKTDVTPMEMGLDFVNKLEPVTYKWDKRSNYVEKGKDFRDLITDGTHKEDWLDTGFLAQDVEALESEYGYNIADKTNLTTTLSDDGNQYGLTYSKFVPMLVKAIQEQNALIEALTARVTTLEG